MQLWAVYCDDWDSVEFYAEKPRRTATGWTGNGTLIGSLGVAHFKAMFGFVPDTKRPKRIDLPAAHNQAEQRG